VIALPASSDADSTSLKTSLGRRNMSDPGISPASVNNTLLSLASGSYNTPT